MMGAMTKRRTLLTREPIILPRETLFAKYLILAAFGVAAFESGVPTLDITTPSGYVPIWAVVITLAAGVSFAACILGRDKVEMWATLVLWCSMTAYVCSALALAADGDGDRVAFAVILSSVLILPFARWVWLILNARKRAPRR